MSEHDPARTAGASSHCQAGTVAQDMSLNSSSERFDTPFEPVARLALARRAARALPSIDLNATLERLAEMAKTLCGVEWAGVRLFGGMGQEIVAGAGLPLCLAEICRSACEGVVQPDKTLWIADLTEGPMSAAASAGPSSGGFFAGAPVMLGGAREAVLWVMDSSPRSFCPVVALQLRRLAALVSDQVQAYETVKLAAIAVNIAKVTSDALVCADREMRITFWNPAAEAMFGYSEAEAVGQSLDILMPDRLASQHRRGYRRVASGGEQRLASTPIELPAKRRSGEEFLIELTLSTLDGPEGRSFAAIIRDCTGRKAEEAARQDAEAARVLAERRSSAALGVLRSFVRRAPIATVMTDAQLRILQVSEAWRDTYGRDLDTLFSRSMYEIFPDARAEWAEIYERGLAGEALEGLTPSGNTRLGERRWMRWSMAPWRDDTKAVAGLLLMNMDVTELVEAREAAERSERTKAEFLANMSHELRTPLNAIMGLTSAVLRAGVTGEQQSSLTTVLTSAAALETILTDILDLARIEAGSIQLDMRPMDFAVLVDEVAALYAPLAAAKALAFESKCWPSTIPIHADGARLRQILSNLLSNAVKFTAEGRVTLKAAAEPSADGVRVYVEVRDTGEGFDPAMAEAIFERFNQADRSITREYGGAGLGLTISRELAGMMGGTILATGRKGEGACFTLSLVAQSAVLEVPSPAEAFSPSSLRILLAEDHPINRQVVETILGGFDVDVVCVENGAQALDALAEQQFDVVLMDIQMPVMDGLTAIGLIRQRELAAEIPRMPIVALSAHAMSEHRATALLAGADLYLTKPVSATTLVAALTEATSRTGSKSSP